MAVALHAIQQKQTLFNEERIYSSEKKNANIDVL